MNGYEVIGRLMKNVCSPRNLEVVLDGDEVTVLPPVGSTRCVGRLVVDSDDEYSPADYERMVDRLEGQLEMHLR